MKLLEQGYGELLVIENRKFTNLDHWANKLLRVRGFETSAFSSAGWKFTYRGKTYFLWLVEERTVAAVGGSLVFTLSSMYTDNLDSSKLVEIYRKLIPRRFWGREGRTPLMFERRMPVINTNRGNVNVVCSYRILESSGEAFSLGEVERMTSMIALRQLFLCRTSDLSFEYPRHLVVHVPSMAEHVNGVPVMNFVMTLAVAIDPLKGEARILPELEEGKPWVIERKKYVPFLFDSSRREGWRSVLALVLNSARNFRAAGNVFCRTEEEAHDYRGRVLSEKYEI